MAGNISPARAAAFEILLRVTASDAHSDDLLYSAQVAALSAQDRNLATALVMGVLRRQIALDAEIAPLLTRPGQRLAEPVAVAVRVGAFQLLYMDRIPAHAAINESVELCRAAGQPRAAGMVNAVLRKVAGRAQTPWRRDPDAAQKRRAIFESPAAFAERLGHPAWLAERWAANYGRETAMAICEAGQQEPQAAGWFARTSDARSDAASLHAAQLQMDDGSRLVAELAATAIASRGDCSPRVWDCCAAPGGKTLVLAERLPRAEILATDISAWRLKQMERRMAGSADAERIRCAVVDAAAKVDGAGGRGLFDLILCDAPCSGTGTLARNPEIRHRLRPEDLTRQAARQMAILRGAIRRLKPGGRLLYSTCSLEPEENEQVVAAMLAEETGMRAVPLEPVLAGLAESGVLSTEIAGMLARTAVREGCLRTVPGVHTCDGFYAALLERAK